MLIVEVHSNDILTIRDGTFACAVSDSKKHETVKFLFPKSWEKRGETTFFVRNCRKPNKNPFREKTTRRTSSIALQDANFIR